MSCKIGQSKICHLLKCSYCTGFSQINLLEEPFLNVNCSHLRRYNTELYSQLVRYPQEVIPTFDMATNELFAKLFPDTVLEHQIQVCVCVCVGVGVGVGGWVWGQGMSRCVYDALIHLCLGTHFQC